MQEDDGPDFSLIELSRIDKEMLEDPKFYESDCKNFRTRRSNVERARAGEAEWDRIVVNMTSDYVAVSDMAVYDRCVYAQVLTDDERALVDAELEANRRGKLVGTLSGFGTAYNASEQPCCGEDDLTDKERKFLADADPDVLEVVRELWAGNALEGSRKGMSEHDAWRSRAAAVCGDFNDGGHFDEASWEMYARHGLYAAALGCVCWFSSKKTSTLDRLYALGRALARAGVTGKMRSLSSVANSGCNVYDHKWYAGKPCGLDGDDGDSFHYKVEGPDYVHLANLVHSAYEAERKKYDEATRDANYAANMLTENGGLADEARGGLRGGLWLHLLDVHLGHDLKPGSTWLDACRAAVGRMGEDDPSRAEVEAAIERTVEAEQRRKDAAAREEWEQAVAAVDPWSADADLSALLNLPDGRRIWGDEDRLLLQSDAEAVIWEALRAAIDSYGMPMVDGEPDAGALARFYAKATKLYTLEWNRFNARKQGKDDERAYFKDPALAIRWSPRVGAGRMAAIAALMWELDPKGRRLTVSDGVLSQLGEGGVRPVETVGSERSVGGRVRSWFLSIDPEADERTMSAALTRLRADDSIPRFSTADALARHEIDPNSWVINEGRNVITSVGPHAYQMRPAELGDTQRCNMAPGAHYVATSEPDEEGWMDCAPEVPDPAYEVRTNSGETFTWRPADQAAALNPEHPEEMLDAQLQRLSYSIRPSNVERMKMFYVNVGESGSGKTLDAEIATTLVVGTEHPEDRDRLVSAVPLSRFDNDNQLLLMVGKRLNWHRDAGSDPRVGDAAYDHVKSISCGEPISVDVKYGESRTIAINTPQVMNSNHEIRFPSYGNDMMSRQKRVPYYYGIPDDRKSPEIITLAKTDPAITTWYFDQAIHAYPTYDHAYPNPLMDEALTESVKESDTLSQAVAGVVPLLCGHAWPIDMFYQLLLHWMKQNMPNARLANNGPKLRRELVRVLEPYGLVVDTTRQLRMSAWYRPEVMARSVHSLCEAVPSGKGGAKSYRPSALANWVDDLEAATGGRDRFRGVITRREDWNVYVETGRRAFDPAEEVWLEPDEDVDEGPSMPYPADVARRVYERVYLPLVAGLAASDCWIEDGRKVVPVRPLGFDDWVDAGCPNAVEQMPWGSEELGHAFEAQERHTEVLAWHRALSPSGNYVIDVYVELVHRPLEEALFGDAGGSWADTAALIELGRAELAKGGTDGPDDGGSGPGGGATGDVDATASGDADDTVSVTEPAALAAPEPAPAQPEPAAPGTAHAVADAPAPSEEERREAYLERAHKALADAGGYVVLDGGPEGATLCMGVLDDDEWRAYGMPYVDGGTFELDGRAWPLIARRE